MTRTSPNGRAQTLSLAEFNDRAKRIAASTGEVAKGAAKRPSTNRMRRDVRPVETAAASGTETAPKAE